MDSSHMPASPSKPTKKTSGKLLAFMVIVAVLVVGGIIYVLVKPQEKVTEQTNVTQAPAQADSTASLLIASNKKQLPVGEVTEFKVYVDSGETEVNAVEAAITFSEEVFELVDISYESSGFTVQAVEKIQGGKIIMQRGALKNVIGETLVATIQLKALKPISSTELKIGNKSKVLQVSDSTNILDAKQGAAIEVVGE